MPSIDVMKSNVAAITESDRIFLSILHEIERYYMEFSKAIRVRVEKWVEKLSLTGHNYTWRKHRNAYAKLLLNMILNRELSEPFNSLPPEGSLQSFPMHLKAYSVRGAYDRSGGYGLSNTNSKTFKSQTGKGSGSANYVANTIINNHNQNHNNDNHRGSYKYNPKFQSAVYGGCNTNLHSTLFWRDVYQAVQDSPMGDSIAQTIRKEVGKCADNERDIIINHIQGGSNGSPVSVPASVPIVPIQTSAPIPPSPPQFPRPKLIEKEKPIPIKPNVHHSYLDPTVASIRHGAHVHHNSNADEHLKEVEYREEKHEHFADEHNPHLNHKGHEHRGNEHDESEYHTALYGQQTSASTSTSAGVGTSEKPSHSPSRTLQAANKILKKSEKTNSTFSQNGNGSGTGTNGNCFKLSSDMIDGGEGLINATKYVVEHGGGITKFHYSNDQDGQIYMSDEAEYTREIRRLALLIREQHREVQDLKSQIINEKEINKLRLIKQSEEHFIELKSLLTSTCKKCCTKLIINDVDEDDSLDEKHCCWCGCENRNHDHDHIAAEKHVSFESSDDANMNTNIDTNTNTSVKTHASGPKQHSQPQPQPRAHVPTHSVNSNHKYKNANTTKWFQHGKTVSTDTECDDPPGPIPPDRVSLAWEALMDIDHQGDILTSNFPAKIRSDDRYYLGPHNDNDNDKEKEKENENASSGKSNRNSSRNFRSVPLANQNADVEADISTESGNSQSQSRSTSIQIPRRQPKQSFNYLERTIDREHYEYPLGTRGSMFRTSLQRYTHY